MHRIGMAMALACLLAGCAPGKTPPGQLVCQMRLGMQPARSDAQAWALLARQIRDLSCIDDLQAWTTAENGQPVDHLVAFSQRDFQLFMIAHPQGSSVWTWTRVENLSPKQVLARPSGASTWPSGAIVAHSSEGVPANMRPDLQGDLRLFGFAAMIPPLGEPLVAP